MKPTYGYCAVTADFFHIGHLHFLRSCKEHCENLIVGVMADECVETYKGRRPFQKTWAREEIIKSMRFVHRTIVQTEFDFPHSIMRLKDFYQGDFIIMDSDENAAKRKGSDIIIKGGIIRDFGISSTMLKDTL